MRHVPRQRKRFYLRIDFERLRPVRPVQEVRIVTDTPVGVLRVIVILPSRLHVAVVHRSQTSTGWQATGQAMNLRLRIMPGSRAARNNPKVRVADDPARIVEQPKVDDRQSLDGHTTT